VTVARWGSSVIGAMLVGFGGAACLESPQGRLEYSAIAVSTGQRTIDVGGWTVTLDRAELAFGPAYFCAARSGSATLCASAIAEIPSVARVDALSRERSFLGRVVGLTGHVESVSYDLGIHWLDTQQGPTRAGEALNGHSIELSGVATKGTVSIPFIASIDVVPQFQGQHAVATAPAVGDVESSDVVLEVHFDPVRWLAQVDFDAAAMRSERPLVFGAGSQEHNALLAGLKSLAPIEFKWSPIQL
jgi:hypothetical protein